MKPTPKDWPRITSALTYRDASAAIDWLSAAFGFTVRLRVDGDGGRVEHSELVYGDGVVMLSSEGLPDGAANNPREWKRNLRSPLSTAGVNTQTLMLYVDDADAHCAHARAHGARIIDEPSTHDYGAEYWADRSYGALDIEGHLWWVTQRLRSAPGQ